MKSAEVKARAIPSDQADVWLADVRAQTAVSLRAAFGEAQLRRRAHLLAAWTLGVWGGLAAVLALRFFPDGKNVVTWTVSFASGLGLVLTAFYLSAALRQKLESIQVQRQASASIKIVADPDSPPTTPAPEEVAPSP